MYVCTATDRKENKAKNKRSRQKAKSKNVQVVGNRQIKADKQGWIATA